MDFPIKNGGSFLSYVSSPEGKLKHTDQHGLYNYCHGRTDGKMWDA